MSVVLGVNAVFHDPAAALVVDGQVVAAAEEERFSRRKHGKAPVPFSTWELPEQSITWCLDMAGLGAGDLDAVAYSYDPSLAPVEEALGPEHEWEGLRTLYARRAPQFLSTLLPELDPSVVHHVRHHVAHAASAWGAAPFDSCAVLVTDGRGESTSSLTGVARDGTFRLLGAQALPHSLGLRYEELTQHLGYRRSSDEYKVMAMASYGRPRHLERFRELMRGDGRGGFVTEPIDWSEFAPPGRGDGSTDGPLVDLAASVQARLEELLIETATWLHDTTGESCLAMAGGVALNCVANSRLLDEGPFEQIWVQPAAGDGGTALGAALQVASELGDRPRPMRTAALGPEWDDGELEGILRSAAVPFERPDDLAAEVAAALAADGVVAWFQGRSEFGPRALGHRSLLAHPGHARNLSRLNDVKGREHFRPVAPMVLVERAPEVVESGPIPSPHMLFVHRLRAEWAERMPAIAHVDGTARAQTVDGADEPLLHRMLQRFEALTGLPAVVNTSLNTAGRPMVDHPRDALECFGSAPIDVLAIGPFLVRRATFFAAARAALPRGRPGMMRGGSSPGDGPGRWPTPSADVVIPTIGRPSLGTLLDRLDAELGTRPGLVGRVVVVHDRPDTGLDIRPLRSTACAVVAGPARGPAAARNVGWHATSAPWVVFLDDDVEVGDGWAALLEEDLASASPEAVAVQGVIEVPLDPDRPPDDTERGVAQLAQAAWITADMAVRRSALVAVGGFDERFPRAYREDTDLARRLLDAGFELREGRRVTRHPVRPARWTECLGRQRGNADDALMRRLHGPDWRQRGSAPAGRRGDHVGTTVVALGAATALVSGRRRIGAVLVAAWGWQWWRFLSVRRTPGRDGALGCVQLAVTSAAIPPLATTWWLIGLVRARRCAPGGEADRWHRLSRRSTGEPSAVVLNPAR